MLVRDVMQTRTRGRAGVADRRGVRATAQAIADAAGHVLPGRPLGGRGRRCRHARLLARGPAGARATRRACSTSRFRSSRCGSARPEEPLGDVLERPGSAARGSTAWCWCSRVPASSVWSEPVDVVRAQRYQRASSSTLVSAALRAIRACSRSGDSPVVVGSGRTATVVPVVAVPEAGIAVAGAAGVDPVGSGPEWSRPESCRIRGPGLVDELGRGGDHGLGVEPVEEGGGRPQLAECGEPVPERLAVQVLADQLGLAAQVVLPDEACPAGRPGSSRAGPARRRCSRPGEPTTGPGPPAPGPPRRGAPARGPRRRGRRPDGSRRRTGAGRP